MVEKLIYIKLIGKDSDLFYRYIFYFGDTANQIIEDEENLPCGLNSDNEILEKSFKSKYTIKTKIKLNLIQDNMCFSFEHARYNVVALAYEDIDDYDEYPADGRLVFMFGEPYEDVERKLAMKGIIMI